MVKLSVLKGIRGAVPPPAAIPAAGPRVRDGAWANGGGAAERDVCPHGPPLAGALARPRVSPGSAPLSAAAVVPAASAGDGAHPPCPGAGPLRGRAHSPWLLRRTRCGWPCGRSSGVGDLGLPVSPPHAEAGPRQLKLFEKAEPGESVQVDVKFVKIAGQGAFQYTALDDCTRFRVLRLYRRLDHCSSLAFLAELRRAFPFPIRRLQRQRPGVLVRVCPRRWRRPGSAIATSARAGRNRTGRSSAATALITRSSGAGIPS